MTITPPILQSWFTYWENQPHNADYLKTWLKRVPCIWRIGLLEDCAQDMTDFEIEACLRNYLFEHIFWTGDQQGDPTFVDSPVNLLQQLDTMQSMNDDKGPTWSCGPLAAVEVGLLAMYGIAARRVWVSAYKDGQVADHLEYYDRQSSKWVMVDPVLNMHWMNNTGRRLSAQEWCLAERYGTVLVPCALNSNQGNPKWAKPDDFPGLKGMSGYVAVARSNWPHAGMADKLDPSKWEHFAVAPPLGNVRVGNPTDPTILPWGTFNPQSITNGPS